MLDHASRLAAWLGEEPAMRAFRKHSAWYTRGFPGGAALRERLMRTATLGELEAALGMMDRNSPFPPQAVRLRRGKGRRRQKVALPHGYLDDLDDATPPGAEAETLVSGG